MKGPQSAVRHSSTFCVQKIVNFLNRQLSSSRRRCCGGSRGRSSRRRKAPTAPSWFRPGTRNPNPETRNPEPGTQNPKVGLYQELPISGMPLYKSGVGPTIQSRRLFLKNTITGISDPICNNVFYTSGGSSHVPKLSLVKRVVAVRGYTMTASLSLSLYPSLCVQQQLSLSAWGVLLLLRYYSQA